MMETWSGGRAVAATLEALGVRHAFGIASVHNLPIVDALLDSGVTFVPVRHEQAAVHAADGYARATGELGVVVVSTGPGSANAMHGLYEAAFASSPVLLLTGQVATTVLGKGRSALHEAEEQDRMLATVTRRSTRVRSTAAIPRTILELVRDMREGRPQPGAVEIPIDLQYATALVETPTGPLPIAPVIPDTAALDRAAELLAKAARPIIWAGGGVRAAGAEPQLHAIAEHLQAPVLTSISGRGALADDDHLCIGSLAGMREELPQLLASCDAMLAVGTRFQDRDTNGWRIAMPTNLVHLDVDPSTIDRSYRASVPIVGDAAVGLDGLLVRLGEVATDTDHLDTMTDLGKRAREAMRARIGPDHTAIMDAIRDRLPDDGVIVRDATIPAYQWADRLLPVRAPRTTFNPSAAGIGPGLPLGLGAAIGTARPTIVIHGDGGLMLNLGELATVAEADVPLIVCVFNDRGYGILRILQDRMFSRQSGVDLATPDFVALSRSMGLTAEPVSGVDAFVRAFDRALQRGGPTLLEIDMASLAPMDGPGPSNY